MHAPSEDSVRVWLATALAISLVLSMAIAAGLVVAGDTAVRAVRSTAPGHVVRLRGRSRVDSWHPMLRAYQRKIEDPRSDLYAVFFEDHVKFQYPPAALMVFDLVPASMTRLVDGRISEALHHWLDWRSRAALALTVLTSAVILEIGVRRLAPDRPARPVWVGARIGLSVALGLTYFPVLTGYTLGQIQVFLNALIALAVLFYLLGRQVPAGVCIGLCCLVKPQYGLILLWSLLRRQRRFTLGLTGALLVGLAISVVRFGLQDHVRYLEVVRELSRVGEAFWFNQSANGLLNRLLNPGDPSRFSLTDFPPYHPVVYTLTVISSVAILVLALWPRKDGHRADGGVIDLMVIVVATTMASPIAWNHHYGAFLPILAAAVPGLILARPLGRATAPLFALSYVMMANVMIRSDLLFRNPWVGLAGSHVFFGSLIFFGLLLALRAVAGPWADARGDAAERLAAVIASRESTRRRELAGAGG